MTLTGCSNSPRKNVFARQPFTTFSIISERILYFISNPEILPAFTVAHPDFQVLTSTRLQVPCAALSHTGRRPDKQHDFVSIASRDRGVREWVYEGIARMLVCPRTTLAELEEDPDR